MPIKRAADATAEKYWTEYLGDYGELLVRDIVKTVRAQFDPKIRAASSEGPVSHTNVQCYPVGRVKYPEHTIIDGVYTATRRDYAGEWPVQFLFTATVNSQGHITDFNSRAVRGT